MPAISQSFRCFDEVVRRGSVRKASERLHLTPAAVNQQILNLEALVGVPLFDRLPRGMRLNAAGEIMVAAVRRSQRDFDSALAQVEDLRQLRRGHIDLGVSPSTAEELLPQVIETVLGTHPGLSFNVRTGAGEALLRWLAQGEIDVVFCLHRTPPPGVEEVRAFAQQLGVVTAPGHALTRLRRAPRLRDCLDHPLVLMSPDTELRAMAELIEPSLQARGRPMVETSSLPLVRRLLAGGQAVGFLIAENVLRDVDEGRLVWTALADPAARLHSGLYQRKNYAASVAMGIFVEALGDAVDRVGRRFEVGGA